MLFLDTLANARANISIQIGWALKAAVMAHETWWAGAHCIVFLECTLTFAIAWSSIFSSTWTFDGT